MTTFRNLIATAVCVVMLTACSTVPGNYLAALDCLDGALNSPVAALENQANEGNARAQYALSIIYRFGLRGYPVDRDKAYKYHSEALAPRGQTYDIGPPFTATPEFELGAIEAGRNALCAKALDKGQEISSAYRYCGGPEAFRRLKQQWDAAAAR